MDLLSTVLRRPAAEDDKYSRGVVGFVTGSTEFPGAAILGVTAAIRTGVGMVRWLGPNSVGNLVIEVRPEVVLQDGRAQAWVLGSGVGADPDAEQGLNVSRVASMPGYSVIDAGALDILNFSKIRTKAILTPHAGEASRLLEKLGHQVSRTKIEAEPIQAALHLSQLTGQVILLKGSISTVATPAGETWQSPPSNPALATAGSGDVLAGILGALIASNFERLESQELSLELLARAGVILHSKAADLAAEAGPVAALDIAESVRQVVGEHYA